MSTTPIDIRPQPGPQEDFLASSADIVIYGGAAGGGKTFGLLMDPLRYVSNPQFGAVLFRRTYPEITQEKGIWDESQRLYGYFDTRVNESDLKHTFPSGATVRFAHLQHEKTKYNYKSSQIAYLGFDELTSFTESQFFYMLSRNRSVSGVPPCVRACTNPEPGWVADLIRWWLHTDEGHPRYGYPIEARAGRLRYFARGTDDELIWGASKGEVLEQAPHLKEGELDPRHAIKSLTFIPATIYDNQILLDKNPEYLANLKMQSKVERERLLGGNWFVTAAGGDYFDRSDFEVPFARRKYSRIFSPLSPERFDSDPFSDFPWARCGRERSIERRNSSSCFRAICLAFSFFWFFASSFIFLEACFIFRPASCW